MSSGRSSFERSRPRGRRRAAGRACAVLLSVLLGRGLLGAQAIPPPPDNPGDAPAPTPAPSRPQAPKTIQCPRCGYLCDPAWHYCVACGWDLTTPIGDKEEQGLQKIARSTLGVTVGARRSRFATAFPFGEAGLLLTNARVLIGADESRLKIRTFNNLEYSAHIVGYDLPSGVGVLKADIPGLFKLEKSPARPAPPGAAWAVCYPVAFEDDVVRYLPVSLHRGRLTAVGESGTNLVTFENLLRTDHAIEDGCTGGPLVDPAGRLVGMILGSPDDGITFATPLDELAGVVETLARGDKPSRPYFGLGLAAPDERRRSRFGLDAAAGHPVVAYVIPGSPAERAGIRPGDLLGWIGQDAIANVREAVRRLLAAAPGGAPLSLTVQREGVNRTFSVQAEKRPERIMLDPIDEIQETLEANLKEGAGESGSAPGLVVSDLVRGGRGEKNHFRNGDTITAVDDKSVKTFKGFDDLIRSKFKDLFATSQPKDERFSSSYVVTLEVRRVGEDKIGRDYVNLFPDFLAPPVY